MITVTAFYPEVEHTPTEVLVIKAATDEVGEDRHVHTHLSHALDRVGAILESFDGILDIESDDDSGDLRIRYSTSKTSWMAWSELAFDAIAAYYADEFEVSIETEVEPAAQY